MKIDEYSRPLILAFSPVRRRNYGRNFCYNVLVNMIALNMKISFYFTLFYLFVPLATISARADVLSEQNTRLEIVEKIFESSLMDLKASLDQLAERNQFLGSENAKMKNEMQGLEEELENLKKRKSELSGTDEAFLSDEPLGQIKPISEKEILELSRESALLAQENQSVEEKVNIKQKQYDGLRKNVLKLSQAAASLNNQLNSLEEKDRLKEKGQSQIKERLWLSLKEQEAKLKSLRKKQKEKSTMPPSDRGREDQFLQKQSQLKQQVLKLERQWASLSAEEEGSFNQSQRLEGSREAQMDQVDKEINLLTSRKKELEQILTQAKEKLEGLSSNTLEDTLPPLEEKFNSLVQENVSLKEKVSSLERMPQQE